LWRLATARPSRQVLAIWIVGQAGALGLFGFLYRVQISKLQGGTSAQHMQALLANSYFHRGSDHLVGFIFARTFGVLQYTFGQLVVGDLAGLLFVAGIVILLAETELNEADAITSRAPERPAATPRQLALLLMLPFVINAAAAIVDLYPYGGTRHSAFLIPFAVAGVSLSISRLNRRRLFPALGVAVLLVAVCQLFGEPHRPYMRREDQRRSNMMQALDAIQRNLSSDNLLFVDFQTNFLLRFYLCPEATPVALPAGGFRTYTCGGHRVISATSETNVFTADSFPSRWNEMVKTYNLNPKQTVWIFQAGWDIALAQELREKIPRLHDLKSESFGRNISLFKLTVGQPIRG
ncbi:MAG: hypothetical protein WBQ68_17435, partial [Terriglobales bacterium]